MLMFICYNAFIVVLVYFLMRSITLFRRGIFLTCILFLLFQNTVYAKEILVTFITRRRYKDRGYIIAKVVTSVDDFKDNEINHDSESGYSVRVKAAGLYQRAVFNIPDSINQFAIKAYQDINGNGELDKGLFGPKEPVGFSRNPSHRFGMPSYNKSVIDCDNDKINISIMLD